MKKTFGVCVFLLFLALGCLAQEKVDKETVKKIIGDGLIGRSGLMYKSALWSGYVYYFYSYVSPQDSVETIEADISGECCDYAFIIHNRYSESHKTFAEKYIEEWKNKREDEVYQKEMEKIRKNKPSFDAELFERIGGYWVYVYPYCGEFYLHQDWSCLMAVEISREAWIRIDMEVHPSEYLELSGGVEDFTVVFANGEKRFQLIDREREIYRRGGAYMIPVRRIHDFKMIAYCGNGDGEIFPFVKFAWKSH